MQPCGGEMQRLQLQEGHAFVVRGRSAAGQVLARDVSSIIGSISCADTLSTVLMKDAKAQMGRRMRLQGCKCTSASFSQQPGSPLVRRGLVTRGSWASKR
jgi:hypothetical protein